MSQQQAVQKAQSRELTPVEKVAQLFTAQKKAIADALPKHVTPERMMRVALTELRKTPALQRCDPYSFLGAIVQASQLGLEPGGALGHCYLIPYKNEVTLQLGYRGMIDLARRSGNIVSISANVVYGGDTFEVELGTDDRIRHVPAYRTIDEKDIIYVYAVAKLRDGGMQFVVMSLAEVIRNRDTYSSGYKNQPNTSPWKTAFAEMAKKTAVRRLFKMLPTSIEIRDAIAVDDDENQQNHRLIDPNYDVLPPLVDAERFAQVAAAPDAPMGHDPASDADRRVALGELSTAVAAVERAGMKPDVILGRSLDEVRNGTVTTITVAADRLIAAVERT